MFVLFPELTAAFWFQLLSFFLLPATLTHGSPRVNRDIQQDVPVKVLKG
jgi:hypothetical protein